MPWCQLCKTLKAGSSREIQIAREHNYPGVVLFAYAALKQRGWFEKLKAGVFKETALPRTPRKVAVPP